MRLGLINGPYVPHNLISAQGCLVPLLNFQMASRHVRDLKEVKLVSENKILPTITPTPTPTPFLWLFHLGSDGDEK
jgi:hypothetical protein